jgi:MFS family permease
VRRNVEETPVFAQQRRRETRMPVVEAFRHCWPDMLRVVCMALANTIAVVATIFGAAYAVQPVYGIGFHTDVYLWIPVLGNALAVVIIPFVGDWSDRIGRRPLIIAAGIGSGLLSFAYLYAISIHSVPLAILTSLLMWGVVYQGYNAVFPSFYPELFPARMRVSAMAISQNVGTMITALMPALFAAVAPPGANVPVVVGSITFAVGLVVAAAAFSARETYRIRLRDLGDRGAEPMATEEYGRLRARSVAGTP